MVAISHTLPLLTTSLEEAGLLDNLYTLGEAVVALCRAQDLKTSSSLTINFPFKKYTPTLKVRDILKRQLLCTTP